MQASRARWALATALAPLTWGSTYAVTTQWLPPGLPLFTAAVRALPAGLLLVVITRRLPHGVWWLRAAVLGTLNIGAFFALLFVAAYRLPGGMAAVLGAVQPLIVAGLSLPLLARRPSRLTLLAGLIGLAGVGLVVLRAAARPDPWGVAAGSAAAGAMACGIVIGRRWGRPAGVGVLAFTGWQLAIGGLLLAPAALLAEPVPTHLTAVNLAGYGYLATINTLFAYWLWFRGGAVLAPTALSFLSLLSPVGAAVIGWCALGQELGPAQVSGLVLALAGTVLGQLAPGSARGTDHTFGTRQPTPAPAPAAAPAAAECLP